MDIYYPEKYIHLFMLFSSFFLGKNQFIAYRSQEICPTWMYHIEFVIVTSLIWSWQKKRLCSFQILIFASLIFFFEFFFLWGGVLFSWFLILAPITATFIVFFEMIRFHCSLIFFSLSQFRRRDVLLLYTHSVLRVSLPLLCLSTEFFFCIYYSFWDWLID